ncbi:MAG: YggS family pyridoxal phosphate-dependent enzyme [Planctomycetota bacterium]
MKGLAANLAKVRERVQGALDRSGMPARTVTLVAVTKKVPLKTALQLAELGIEDFGENRLPDALERLEPLRKLGLKPHFIGHLQTNKVTKVVGFFDVIHSIDSVRLLDAVALRAEALGRVQEIFLQVNVSGEASKEGVDPEALGPLLERARSQPSLLVLGLMTLAPEGASETRLREVFGGLRELARSFGLAGLSMGMSSDFEVAIEEGATHVRVGGALFGNLA